MIFTLEALHARAGDSLLLHYGDPDQPKLVVIDGGPNHTWERLRERLEEVRESRAPDGRLPIRLVMVSHIDDDHIHGILEMTDAMLGERAGEPRPECAVTAFWHNAFDDVIGRAVAASTASVASVQGASFDELPAKLRVEEQATLVLQSVNQGRRLRDNVAKLGLTGNLPFGGLVSSDHPENPVSLGAGLTFTVLGPAQTEVDALEKEWDEQLRKTQAKKGSPQDMEAVAAGYLDKSAYNLASIVVMAEMDGKRMLLTGDARGDHVLKGLEEKGYLQPGGKMKVDVLKLPHHGSIRNVDRDFFERVEADHYVISADGKHHNPDEDCLRLLTEVRGDAEYTVHVTNRVPHAVRFFDEDQPKRRYRVVYREDDQPSVKVELGDPLPD